MNHAPNANRVALHPKENQVLAENSHANAGTQFGPCGIMQRTSPNVGKLLPDFIHKCHCPVRIVVCDVLCNCIEIALYSRRETNEHLYASASFRG